MRARIVVQAVYRTNGHSRDCAEPQKRNAVFVVIDNRTTAQITSHANMLLRSWMIAASQP